MPGVIVVNSVSINTRVRGHPLLHLILKESIMREVRKKRKERHPFGVGIFMDPWIDKEQLPAITVEALGTSSQIAPPQTQGPLAGLKSQD